MSSCIANCSLAGRVAAGDELGEYVRGRVWIAWERQRRSLTLSERVHARLVLFIDDRAAWLRFPASAWKTIALLRQQRGQIVFVQNPSMVLATIACLLKKRVGYLLVVDRHSNFSHLSAGRASVKVRASNVLSRFTMRRADLTIVTNDELRETVEAAGGRGFVLPDPFPELGPVPVAPEAATDSSRPAEILFVSSWADDEPIAATIEAARTLASDAVIRITGRPKPRFASLLAGAPPNFIPTGFLSDAQYAETMARSDAVMAVTSRAATLVCGGYEGAVMGKPLLLGNSSALRAYFDTGAVYTDGTAADIVAKVRALRAGLMEYRQGIRNFLTRRTADWQDRLAALEATLNELRHMSPAE